MGVSIQLHDKIADLFDVDGGSTNGRRGLWLIERYRIAFAGDEANGVLASLFVGGRKIPRIEVLCMDSSEHLIVIVDGLISISVHMEGFGQFAAFLGQLSLPLN